MYDELDRNFEGNEDFTVDPNGISFISEFYLGNTGKGNAYAEPFYDDLHGLPPVFLAWDENETLSVSWAFQTNTLLLNEEWCDFFRENRFLVGVSLDGYDLVYLLSRGEVNACGLVGNCGTQFVAEADGSVYPCDFYVLDRWLLGNIREQSLAELFDSETGCVFRSRPAERPLCEKCPYLRICGGGCRRMQASVCYRVGDAECGYRMLLDRILPDLTRMASASGIITVQTLPASHPAPPSLPRGSDSTTVSSTTAGSRQSRSRPICFST